MQPVLAISGRSRCRVCHQLIARNTMRVGTPGVYHGKSFVKWHHLACAEAAGIRAPAVPNEPPIVAPPETLERVGVYVLRLHGLLGEPAWYVGKSNNVPSRVGAHQACTADSAAWVQHHRGVACVERPRTPPNVDLNCWEQRETIHQIILHGFEHVRGWEWTWCRAFGPIDYAVFRVCACGQLDLCRRCGAQGHFAAGCVGTIEPWMVRCDAAIATIDARAVVTTATTPPADAAPFQPPPAYEIIHKTRDETAHPPPTRERDGCADGCCNVQ